MKASIRFFEDVPVRAVWDDESSKWWFCAVDIAKAEMNLHKLCIFLKILLRQKQCRKTHQSISQISIVIMKTKEELNTIKEEIKTLNEKLKELTEEELAQVTGGSEPTYLKGCGPSQPLPERAYDVMS